jgi:DNA-binding NarL/FixJ family response regulator
MIRVLVVDDDALARRLIAGHLRGAGVVVVGEARDGQEALEMALRLTPDVVLMDLLMPRCDGIKATQEITRRVSDAQVVLLSVSDDPDAVLLAFRAGAVGFLHKRIDLDALIRVVHGVARGEAGIERSMARMLIEEYRAACQRTQVPAYRGEASPGLSLRERQTLALLCAGYGPYAIACELGLATATVRTHLRSIYAKLGVHDRAAAVEEGRRRGIVGDYAPRDPAAALPV